MNQIVQPVWQIITITVDISTTTTIIIIIIIIKMAGS